MSANNESPRRGDINDGRSLAIGILSVTGMILLVAVIFATVGGQNPARAIGQLDRGGDYIMVTGQFTDNTELVYVTDAAAQRMNAYSFETSTRQFVLWDAINLKAIFNSRK